MFIYADSGRKTSIFTFQTISIKQSAKSIVTQVRMLLYVINKS